MYWELGFLRVFSCTIVSPYFIVKSLQFRGRRQIAEPRKYRLVRVIVFFDVCFLYLFCFSQIEILVKIPYNMELYNCKKVDITDNDQKERVNQMIEDQKPFKGKPLLVASASGK